MPLDASGHWYPNLFAKQLQGFNSRARCLLLCGARYGGKSWTALHKLVRHLYETPKGRVAMFSKTIKNAKDGGVWSDLTNIVLPEWFAANIGLQYTTLGRDDVPGPKVDGQTRSLYFRVSNAYGGESEVILFSLDYDLEVETKLKETRFSMIYFSELSKFTDRRVLSASMPQLRMPHLTYEQHQWMADTNPSAEGDASWIYQVWYVERTQTYAEYVANCIRRSIAPLDEELFLEFQKDLELIEIQPGDNPFLDPKAFTRLKIDSSYDPGIYARDVEGKWIYGDGDASRHFRGIFNRHVHVVGSTEGPEADWTYATPPDNSFELILGFDPGDTNQAVAIMSKEVKPTVANGRPCYTVVDEVVSIKKDLSMEQLTEDVMEKVELLEAQAGHPFNLDRAYSDRSAVDRYRASADTYDYLVIYAASNERIYLKGVPKARGAVKLRVQLLKQLLHQERFKVSAHCAYTIQMLEELKKGRIEFVPEQDTNKHIFDAITYALLAECAEDLELSPRANVTKRQAPPLLVQV